MQRENPYQPPAGDADDHVSSAPAPAKPPRDRIAELTADTVMPRHIAASLDMTLMLLLMVVAAKQLPNDWPLAQTALAIAVYPTYFLLWEGLTARTPGKLLTGLVIVDLSGRRCSWRQTLIRTLYRMFEVNPLLLGALPAALCIFTSPHHQRFGDKAASTIVVPTRRLKKRKSSAKNAPPK